MHFFSSASCEIFQSGSSVMPYVFRRFSPHGLFTPLTRTRQNCLVSLHRQCEQGITEKHTTIKGFGGLVVYLAGSMWTIIPAIFDITVSYITRCHVRCTAIDTLSSDRQTIGTRTPAVVALLDISW